VEELLSDDSFRVVYDASSEAQKDSVFVWQQSGDVRRWDFASPRSAPVVGDFVVGPKASSSFGTGDFGCLWLRGSTPPGQADVSCDESGSAGNATNALTLAMMKPATYWFSRDILGQPTNCYGFSNPTRENGRGTICVNEDGLPLAFRAYTGGFHPEQVALEAVSISEVQEFDIDHATRAELLPPNSIIVPVDVLTLPPEVLVTDSP
jgi:hypothetical protein